MTSSDRDDDDDDGEELIEIEKGRDAKNRPGVCKRTLRLVCCCCICCFGGKRCKKAMRKCGENIGLRLMRLAISVLLLAVALAYHATNNDKREVGTKGFWEAGLQAELNELNRTLYAPSDSGAKTALLSVLSALTYNVAPGVLGTIASIVCGLDVWARALQLARSPIKFAISAILCSMVVIMTALLYRDSHSTNAVMHVIQEQVNTTLVNLQNGTFSGPAINETAGTFSSVYEYITVEVGTTSLTWINFIVSVINFIN